MVKVKLQRPQEGPQEMAARCPADEILYGGAAGGGKALSLDTPISTPSGWTTMGAISIGDQVFDERGEICNVIAISKTMLGHKIYKVIFDDNSEILADAEHLWLTSTINSRQSSARFKRKRNRASSFSRDQRHKRVLDKVVTTDEIRNTLYDRGRTNHAIQVAAPLQCGTKELLIDPYVLGAWLGDGTAREGTITCYDPEIIANIKAAGFVVTRWPSDEHAFSIHGLITKLGQLNLLNNKHIPSHYLRASEAQRWQLLAGLMDTDGECDSDGGCGFSQKIGPLAENVSELLHSLGIKHRRRIRRVYLNGVDCGEHVGFRFTIANKRLFNLRRKQERQVIKERGTQQWRYIKQIEEVESVPVKCITVDSPSKLYLVGRSMIPTHNTWWLLYTMWCYITVPEFRGLILRRTTPELKQPGGLIDESYKMFSHKGTFTKTVNRWTFPSGAILDFDHMEKEQDKTRYQGGQYDIVAFDQVETFTKTQYLYMPSRIRNNALDPRTGKPVPQQLLATANPPLPGQPGAEWLIPRFSAWIDRLHPNPAESGEVRAYKLADDREVEVSVGASGSMTRTFIKATVWDNKILLEADPRYINRLSMQDKAVRASMLEGDFYAFAGAEANKVIAYALVQRAQEEWTVDGKGDTPLTAIACDVAMGGNRCIIGKRYGNWIAPLEEYPGDPQDLMALANHLVLVREDERAPIIVDVVGIGAGVVSKLKELRVTNVVAFNGSNKSTRLDKSGHLKMRNLRAEAHWVTREILADGIIVGDDFEPIALPPDSELLSELCAPTWDALVSGVTIEKKKLIERRLGRSPDKGDTIIMLLWAGSYVPPQMVVEETEFAEEMRSRRESSWRDDL